MSPQDHAEVPIFLILTFQVGGLADNVERNDLKNLLLQFEDRRQLQVVDHYVDSAASLGEILDRYPPASICYIHAIGHGENRVLQMLNSNEQIEPLQASQFAQMLTLREIKPRLVFLNACDSKSMFPPLKRLGVPVIGYEGDVEDRYATEIAKQFYHHSIATSKRSARSISNAFGLAVVECAGHLNENFRKPTLSADKSSKDSLLFDFSSMSTDAKDRAVKSKVSDPHSPPETSAALLSNLPFESLGNHLYGRIDDLNVLRESFDVAQGKNAQLVRHVISAMAGIGKTCLAVEYAWRNLPNYQALLFVRAYSSAVFEESLANLAVLLHIKTAPDAVIQDKIAAVERWFAETSGWLLIVDNVDDPEMQARISQWSASLGAGHLLITTRISKWDRTRFDLTELKKLSKADSVDFLMRGTEADRQKRTDDEAVAEEIDRELDGHCLALTQAVGYVNYREITLDTFLKTFRSNSAQAREFAASLLALDDIDREEARSVTTTFLTTFARLSPETRTWLKAFAWLAPEPIPDSFCETFSEVINDDDWRGRIAELRRFSLLSRSERNFPNIGQMHRLVQMVVREGADDSTKGNTSRIVVTAMVRSFSGDPQDSTNWSQLGPLVEHVAALMVQSSCGGSGLLGDLGLFGNRAGLMLFKMGRFMVAGRLFGPLVEHVAALLVQGRYGSSGLLGDLGLLGNRAGLMLFKMARFEAAEGLYRRALSIDESSYGPDHPNVARDLNNLAGLLDATNRFSAAEELYRRALSINESSYGRDHPNVAIVLNNLAGLLDATNRFSAAEELYRRALSINESSYGRDHPKVALVLNNLAGLLDATNRFSAAGELYRRALSINESSYGRDHPNVAIVLNNLAGLHRDTNRFSAAEELYRCAAKILLRCFGENHSGSITVVTKYRILLQERGLEPNRITQEVVALCDETGVNPNGLLNRLEWRRN